MPRYNLITTDDEEERREITIKAFAENIRNVRLSKKLTQEHVAERAGINPKYLGEIERGLKSPTAPVVYKLATALSVPVCVIISMEACPCRDNGVSSEVAAVLAGKRVKDIRKAVRMLEILFE